MTLSSHLHKALFLDRDGVININHGYVYQVAAFDWVDGIFELVAVAQALNYKIIVVTNQSGIGRGYYSENDFHVLTDWMQSQFAKKDLRLDKIYFCPHHPSHAKDTYKKQCECRKPSPGMAFQAASELSIDLSASVMVGDKLSDIEFAENAKMGKAYLLTHKTSNISLDQDEYSIDVNKVSTLSEIKL